MGWFKIVWSRSHQKRHAALTSTFVSQLDKCATLMTLARLRGSALRGTALGRAIVILAVIMTIQITGIQKIDSAEAESLSVKPFHIMNLKLYAYNQMAWNQFECYNELIFRESRWNPNARNGSHYGLGQVRSEWYRTLNPIEQIDAHIKYLKHRYPKHMACGALAHLKRYGWH